MSEHRHVPEPGELIYTAEPSWGPAFFAVGVTGLICGIYAAGFIFPAFFYAVIGAIFVLAAFRGLSRGAVRDYFQLPRKQHVRSAALPIETLSVPTRPRSSD